MKKLTPEQHEFAAKCQEMYDDLEISVYEVLERMFLNANTAEDVRPEKNVMMPRNPKKTRTIKAKFRYVGRGKPKMHITGNNAITAPCEQSPRFTHDEIKLIRGLCSGSINPIVYRHEIKRIADEMEKGVNL